VLCSGGGGIWSSGNLTVDDSAISGCSADWGGGLYDRSTAILRRSVFVENSAGFDGGGLLSFDTLVVIESTVADNAAGQSGGGISNEAGSLEVSASTISSNTAAAAGGAIYNPAGASTSVVNTTLSGNVARSGGAIYTGGSLSLVSSTLAENEAPDGSALFDPGSSSASPRSIRSTLVVGRCGGTPFDSEGYNVESTGDTCGFDQLTDRPSQGAIDLGPLGDNGGPTLTHALPGGSIAIDRVPEVDCIDEVGAPLVVDQRGEPRPAGETARCDVGAFEAQR
jgi:predicted outer membrane repeat protein